MSGYFFDAIEVGRLLNPGLDLLAVEARVPELVRLGERQLGHQLVD